MSDAHEKIQKQIMDAFYEEKQLKEKLKKHLNNCKECSVFLESMNLIRDDLPLKGVDIKVDEKIIEEAFREAEKRKEKTKNIREYIIFSLVSIFLLSSVGMFAYMGYDRIIVGIEIFIFIFAPILVPFLIRHRLSKEVD